jgi:hypothetical protein
MITLDLTHEELERLYHLVFVDSIEWFQKGTDDANPDKAICLRIYEDRKVLRSRLEALRQIAKQQA